MSNVKASSDADLIQGLKDAVGPSITDADITQMMTLYPESLNKLSFFGRDVSPEGSKNISARKGTGTEWQRNAAMLTEIKFSCIAHFLADMVVSMGVKSVYQYRHNVVDNILNGRADTGVFSDHTSELYQIWGANNTDEGDPKCLTVPAAQGGCAESIPIVMSYWISFVKTLDPNSAKLAGTPDWKPWTVNGKEQIVFDNSAATMEAVGKGLNETVIAGMNQRQRCDAITLRLTKQNNANLKAGQTLAPFANGTRVDPTLAGSGKTLVGTTSASASELLKGAASGTLADMTQKGNNGSVSGSKGSSNGTVAGSNNGSAIAPVISTGAGSLVGLGSLGTGLARAWAIGVMGWML